MQCSDHQPMLLSHVVMFCITLLCAASATASETPPYSACGKKGIAVVYICTSARSSTVKSLVNQR